ncbi:MAG: hypothetical protein AB1627_11525 [Chloroflexota bacterium]
MSFDLGIQGLGILVACALVFGAAAHVLLGRGTRWMWLVGAAGWFIGGLFASEVVWGTLTEDEIQPIIDGLAFDESMLGGLILGLAAVLVAWFATRRMGHQRPLST